MSALLAIFLVLLLTLALLYFILRDFGVITPKQKLISLSTLIVFGILIALYSYFQSQSDRKDFMLQTAFKRGESLECNGIIINKENFNLVTGTLSFIGKKNTPMNNIIVPLDKCNIIQKQDLPQDQDTTSKSLEEELQRD
ncbi:hypothetical protein [Helicobacter sp. 11S03491-1]|uniref:hypothetical protein n=1 Tax=Helicobacter sp. 11S03491-1 TaxID=1476196 RepID=UPI000BC90228|nr:hypothetical protein [Helicobacter sp. 11S03491-1]PAF41310.1 hypothetical protein BKH45_07310 [Helicobacter sp. 11S03491-1]